MSKPESQTAMPPPDSVAELVAILADAGVPEDRARELAWQTATGLWNGQIDREVVARAMRNGDLTEAEAEEFIKNGR